MAYAAPEPHTFRERGREDDTRWRSWRRTPRCARRDSRGGCPHEKLAGA